MGSDNNQSSKIAAVSLKLEYLTGASISKEHRGEEKFQKMTAF